jgi:hypothetical protein
MMERYYGRIPGLSYAGRHGMFRGGGKLKNNTARQKQLYQRLVWQCRFLSRAYASKDHGLIPDPKNGSAPQIPHTVIQRFRPRA